MFRVELTHKVAARYLAIFGAEAFQAALAQRTRRFRQVGMDISYPLRGDHTVFCEWS